MHPHAGDPVGIRLLGSSWLPELHGWFGSVLGRLLVVQQGLSGPELRRFPRRSLTAVCEASHSSAL